MSGITRKAAQDILDEDMKKIQPYIEQLTRITKKYQEIYDFLQEKQKVMFDDDSISSEDLAKMTEPLCRGLSYYDRDFKAKIRGYTDETSPSVELLIRETAYLADNIVNRTVANRKKMLISARAGELKQMFKKGTMICIDEVLAKENAAYDIGVFFNRRAHVLHIWPDVNKWYSTSYGRANSNYRPDPSFKVPENAFDVGELDDQGRKTYKVPVSPSYDYIYDSGYKPLRLSPTETALVVDTSTSKSYVKVITSTPVREVWLRRTGLLVAK